MTDGNAREKEQPEGDESVPTVGYGPGAEGPGSQIGPYKLLRILGEGGYGIVYLAEQQEPVKRRVALKVIKPGMDTKQVIARFEAERQALALLDHPNIAHVFHAGATDAARPYFAMEYVKGVPITEHCDRYKLTIEERLKLFLAVCEAVQHAHQKAIIHRDIKPSNILVAYEGEQAVPMIIDFGVAKALTQSLTERTLVTEQAQMIGTPEYMSPEQAEMTSQDIDTRTDIYSLGVLLYELLTGTLPFDSQTLREGGPEGMRRMIREQDPQTPSARLSTIERDESVSLALHRGADVRAWGHRLHGELDWITLKAMDKDRTRRYQTAHALAEDIQRYLNQEPVLAGPPDALYKLRKLIRRNRVVFASAAAVAAILIVATVVSVWQMVRANQAAEQQRIVSGQLTLEKERAVAAEEAAKLARDQAEVSEKDARVNLYAADMKATEQLLGDGNLGAARQLLRAYLDMAPNDDIRGWEWRYLWQKAQGDQEKRLASHKDIVLSVAFSPNGEMLASGGEDQAVIVRDKDGKILLRQAADSKIISVSFSKDGRYLAAATGRGSVLIWDAASLQLSTRFPGPAYCGAFAAFSPTDTLLAIGYGTGRIGLWDYGAAAAMAWLGPAPENDAQDPNLYKTDHADCALAFSSEGKYLAICAMGTRRYDVWDVESRTRIATLADANGIPFNAGWQYARFIPGTTELFISNMNWDMRRTLWDFKTNRVTCPVSGTPSSKITHTAFSSDGTLMVTGGQDHSVRLWDVSARPFREMAPLWGHRGEIRAVALSPDGKRIASAGFDHDVLIWNIERQTGSQTARKRVSRCIPFFSRDGRLAVVAGPGTPEGKTLFYDIERAAFRDVEVPGWPIAFTDGETGIIVWRTLDGSNGLAEWDLSQSRWAWQITSGKAPGAALGYDVCRSRGLAAIGWSDGSVRIEDYCNHTMAKSWKPHDSAIHGIAFSPDGSRILTGESAEILDEHSIAVWSCTDLNDIRPLYYIQGDRRGLHSAVFSPNGRILATGTIFGRIMLWDAECGAFLRELVGHKQAVGGLAFSPDGRTLASSNDDQTVKLWHVPTGRELLTFHMPFRMHQVAFSPDGRTLIGVSDGRELTVWRVPSLEEIAVVESERGGGMSPQATP
ncbi:MAG: protein kinase [Sedimentisphaerales bacterium]|nr:protein kinase [Sedimentisphaerales bacterium]